MYIISRVHVYLNNIPWPCIVPIVIITIICYYYIDTCEVERTATMKLYNTDLNALGIQPKTMR